MKDPVFEIIQDNPTYIQLSFAGDRSHFDAYLTFAEFEGIKNAIQELPKHLNELCKGHANVELSRKQTGPLASINQDHGKYELQFVDWNNSVWAQIPFSKKGWKNFVEKIVTYKWEAKP